MGGLWTHVTALSLVLSPAPFASVQAGPWAGFVPCRAWGCCWTLSPDVVGVCGVVSGLARDCLPWATLGPWHPALRDGWPWPVQTRYRQFMGKVNLQGSGSKAVSVCFTLRDNSVCESLKSLLDFTDGKLKMVSLNINFAKESPPWWPL